LKNIDIHLNFPITSIAEGPNEESDDDTVNASDDMDADDQKQDEGGVDFQEKQNDVEEGQAAVEKNVCQRTVPSDQSSVGRADADVRRPATLSDATARLHSIPVFENDTSRAIH